MTSPLSSEAIDVTLLPAFERFRRACEETMGYSSHVDSNFWVCPAHVDDHPTLFVMPDHDRVLLHCSAGCEIEDVVVAVGLEMTDLLDAPEALGSGTPL